ncbi:MAG: hypothetical protein ACPGQS_12885 [Bradymonadia bacterium]
MKNMNLLVLLSVLFAFAAAHADEKTQDASKETADDSVKEKAEESAKKDEKADDEKTKAAPSKKDADKDSDAKANAKDDNKTTPDKAGAAKSSKGDKKKKKDDLNQQMLAAGGNLAALAGANSSYPISGTMSARYTFNHANFVDSEGDFGTQVVSLGGNVNYSGLKKVILSTGLNGRKSLVNDFFSAGSASQTNEQPWEIGDISINAFAPRLYTIPGVDINVNGSISTSAPLSRASRAFGLVTASTLSTSFQWIRKQLFLSLNVNSTLNVLDKPTMQVDCARAPDVCRIAGSDVGMPLNRLSYGTSLTSAYSLLKGKLQLIAQFGLRGGYSAVEFESDEFSPEYAQSGRQYSMATQSFAYAVRYTLAGKNIITVSSSTAGPIYTNDNQVWRFPLFDTESNLHHRTFYSLSVLRLF